MSNTHKDVKQLDSAKAKRQAHKVAVRFKTERTRKADTRLFKREMQFVNYIMQTSQED